MAKQNRALLERIGAHSAPRPTAPEPNLSSVRRVFVDCQLGLDYAIAQGVPLDAQIVTASPSLMQEPSLAPRALDANIDGPHLAALGRACYEMALDLREAVASEPPIADIGLTIVSAIPDLQRAVYKAMGLTPSDFQTPIVTVDLDFGDPVNNAMYNNPLSRLLSGNPAHRRLVVQNAPPPPDVFHTQAKLWTRLRFEDRQSIAYRVLLNLFDRLRLTGLRGEILIYSENQLVKETAFRLALKGYAIRTLPRPAPRQADLSARERSALERALSGIVARHIGRFVSAPAVGPLSQMLLQLTTSRAEQYQAAFAAWPAHIKAVARRPRAVLGGQVPTPLTAALFAHCRALELPFFVFQHGATLEFTDIADSVRFLREECAAHHYFAFNRLNVEKRTDNPFRVADGTVIGQPADLARTKHRPGPRRCTPPILYASTRVLIGNWQYPATVGETDRETTAFEHDLVDLVLGRLPHRVLFKPYPAIRYLDPDPVRAAARAAPNIEYYDDWIDLRYFAANARLILTAQGTSTVTWCLMSGRPVAFIDLPHQGRLTADARAAFEAGTFYFDGADPDVMAKLRVFLSRPIREIECEWSARAAATRELIERYVGIVDGRAGIRAARTIHEAIK